MRTTQTSMTNLGQIAHSSGSGGVHQLNKAQFAKNLVAGALKARGFSVAKVPGRGADWEINGIRAAVKSSTLWEGRFYKFQQLRNQDFSVVICLGISPFDAHCWVIPMSFIVENWGVPELFPIQHRGREGRDTAWLTVYPENVQPSLVPFGGTLTEAAEVLSEPLAACKRP